MQQEIAAAQTQVSPDRRIVFRIGINLGDVVVEDGDLLGDGVNVAARLEQLCDPGGILLSGTAYDHLHGKLALPVEFTGEKYVKNISRPVRIYRIRLDGRLPRWRPKPTWLRQWHLSTAAALAVLAGGAFLWGPPAEPGVRYVLEGSVRRLGDQVRIDVQLIDAPSSHHRWADRAEAMEAPPLPTQSRPRCWPGEAQRPSPYGDHPGSAQDSSRLHGNDLTVG
jgi:hypothetical protein